MIETRWPAPLEQGDEVRVIAPSRSLQIIGADTQAIATERFSELGLVLSFGQHVGECDDFNSSTIASRVSDLHEAFADRNVKAILTVIGGYNANQLLPFIDWDLIAANPKIFCGYSDITALTCSIYAKTGLVTYSGPHYSTFGMREQFDRTLEWFTAAVMAEQPLVVEPAPTWTDDAWYADQDNRDVQPNDGYWVMAEGQAEGRLVGGNLCTLNLLQGTEYMPDLAGSIVFVEDDFESLPHTFDRDLTSLCQQRGFDQVNGLLIGRFQRQVEITRSKLQAILQSKRELVGLPILANVDFGHTNPILTLPVGAVARFESTPGTSRFEVLMHTYQRGR